MDKIENRPYICILSISICLLSFFTLLLQGGLIKAANIAAQTISFSIQAINEISVSGEPGLMIISMGTAESGPSYVTDSSTIYNITTNESSKKITGQITSGGNMPQGVTLEANLRAPSRGNSQGYRSLSTAAADLVTAINREAEGGMVITYRLSATATAGLVDSDTRVVTLTLSD